MKIADLHCDTISKLLKRKRQGLPHDLRENDCQVDLYKLQKGNYGLQCFALFVNMGQVSDPWAEVIEELALYESQLFVNSDILAPVYDFEDIAENASRGKISALLTVEEGGVCGGSLEKLKTLYDRGVRIITLTWNYQNELGYPANPAKLKNSAVAASGMHNAVNLNISRDIGVLDAMNTLKTADVSGNKSSDSETTYAQMVSIAGLTDKGFEFLEMMEELHMIVDVSHLSDAGFYDVLRHAKRSFMATHSNARALTPHPRNLTDEMIRALSEKGGVMGLNYCADFLHLSECSLPDGEILDKLVTHALHIINVGGIQVLSLGSDFDGIPHSKDLRYANQMERLLGALQTAGIHAAAIDKIVWGNAMRVLENLPRKSLR
ncbi:MAG: dipeptidase [Clostridium sp.]|jgi:membrane dipeptidase|nr:dipeptidase [Clostridium sp.]